MTDGHMYFTLSVNKYYTKYSICCFVLAQSLHINTSHVICVVY